MKNISIDYSGNVVINDETRSHITRADICKETISNNRPFADEQLKKISDFFRTSLTWSSNALEGSSYTIGETQTLLEYGITVQGKSLNETLEVYGHAEAFDYMMQLSKKKGLTLEDICRMHKLIYGKVNEKSAGVFKSEQNFISGSNYSTVSPRVVNEEMKKLEKWIKDNYDELHPIVLAAEVHRKMVYIHPFADGNGRCARLCMNVLLIQNGYLPCAISPSLRLDYINSLEEGRGGAINDFLRFVAEAETETEKDYMRALDIEIPKMPIPLRKDREQNINVPRGPKL